MKYRMSIPCRPRRIDGVDENLRMYRWARANGYALLGYSKHTRTDGHPGWCWELEKVLTEEQEAAAKADYEAKKNPPRPELPALCPEPPHSYTPDPEGEQMFWVMFVGVVLFTFAVVCLLCSHFNINICRY